MDSNNFLIILFTKGVGDEPPPLLPRMSNVMRGSRKTVSFLLRTNQNYLDDTDYF